MSVTTPQEQPVEGQDPQNAAPPVAAPAPPAPVAPPAPAGSAPWAADLNAVFTDEAQRGQVDQFLREKVQPYTTQLEQKASANADAQRLWDALAADPADTYVAITREMYGDEAAQAVRDAFQQQPAPQQPAAEQQQSYDPRVAAALEYVEQQQNSTLYDQELARITTAYPDVDVDLFHDFVSLAEGDFDRAYEMYSTRLAQYAAKFGTPPAAGDPAPPAAPAPPALGSDTASSQSAATPVEPRKQTLDEALNEFMAENRAANQAPPVAG